MRIFDTLEQAQTWVPSETEQLDHYEEALLICTINEGPDEGKAAAVWESEIRTIRKTALH